MSAPVWKDPPLFRGGPGQPRKHEPLLAPLRSAPKRWALIGTYENSKKAANAIQALRHSTTLNLSEWEFTKRGCEVYARFVGEA